MTSADHRLLPRIALAMGALAAMAGCGSDSVTTAPATPDQSAIVITGALIGRLPVQQSDRCGLSGSTGTLTFAASNGGGVSLYLAIHHYTGSPGATYSHLTGAASTTGTVIEVGDSTGRLWVGDIGSITITSSTPSLVTGTIDATLRPITASAANAVAVGGTFACRPQSSGTPSPLPGG